jgi:hypothetical protein
MVASASAALLATWLAQADPAPLEPPAPPPGSASAPAAAIEEAPRPRRNGMAVHGGFAYRASDANDGAPASGFSLGASFEHRYAALSRFAFGVGADFFYDRFSADGDYVSLLPHLVTQTSFAVSQTVSTDLHGVRPWIAAGAGLTVAYYSGTDAVDHQVTDGTVQPLVRGAVGVDVDVAPRQAIVVRADYTHPLTSPTFTGVAASPFGDLVDVGLGFLFRF